VGTSRREPTQGDIREQGKCGHGFNYGGPGGMARYCGGPSVLGATFGDCPEHAREFSAHVRGVDRATARVTEIGPRASLAIKAEHENPQRAITARVRPALDRPARPARTRGRGSR
jgi:hypothetical protein